MTEQPTTTAPAESLSPTALRTKRSRYHAKDDHSLCLPKNCACAPTPTEENDMTETDPTARDETTERFVIGIPELAVYPNGDPSFAERENPAPAADLFDLETVLRSISASFGLANAESKKINAVLQAYQDFDATLPPEVYQAARLYEVARRRQIAMREAKPRSFSSKDLLADDWEARLGRVLNQNAQQDRRTWEPVVGAAVTETGANLRQAVTRALPGVVAQVERWLVANQRDLARYGKGGGNVTPNQATTWQGWASAVWDFARLAADSGGGGQVLELSRSAQTWALLWDWTADQWSELSERTKPGRDLRQGDSVYGVVLAIGAKVSIPLSVLELKQRYARLYETTPVGAHDAAMRKARNPYSM